jgi:uncharacterized damage-inducible protein DinB
VTEHEDATLRPFYQGWETYQRELIRAITPLTAEQLALRAAPSLPPVWYLAAHIIGARVGWFCKTLGAGGPDELAFDPWDFDGAPPRTAAELVEGLTVTWRMIEDCLGRWTPAMLGDSFEVGRGRTVTRQHTIWHVLEHDLHHGGELSLTLGMHGVPAMDL